MSKISSTSKNNISGQGDAAPVITKSRARSLLDVGMTSAAERLEHQLEKTHGDGRATFDLSAQCAQSGYSLRADGVLMGSCLFAVALSFSDTEVLDEPGFKDGLIECFDETISDALKAHSFVSSAHQISTVPALFSYDDLSALSLRDVAAIRRLLESGKGHTATRFCATQSNGDAGLKLVELGFSRSVRWVVGLAKWAQDLGSSKRPQWLEPHFLGVQGMNDFAGFMDTSSNLLSNHFSASIEVGLPADLVSQIRNSAANEVANSLVSLCATLRSSLDISSSRLKISSFSSLGPKETPAWDSVVRIMAKVYIPKDSDWFVAGNFEFDCLTADAPGEIADLVEIAKKTCGITHVDTVQHDEFGQTQIVECVNPGDRENEIVSDANVEESSYSEELSRGRLGLENVETQMIH